MKYKKFNFVNSHNRSVYIFRHSWKIILPLMMALFLWYSCEEVPIVDESHSTELEISNEPSDPVHNLNFEIDHSNFVSLSIDTLDVDQGINTRSSTCDVEISITKAWGDANYYTVKVVSEGDDVEYFNDIVYPGTYGSNSETVEDIEDTKSYDITIIPNPGSTSERFSFRITTPSLAYTYTFDLDTTSPANEVGEIDGFDHFDCP